MQNTHENNSYNAYIRIKRVIVGYANRHTNTHESLLEKVKLLSLSGRLKIGKTSSSACVGNPLGVWKMRARHYL